MFQVDLKNWLLIFTQRDSQKALGYLNAYKKIAPQLGINISAPRDIGLPDDRTDSFIKAIRDSVNNQVCLYISSFLPILSE